MKLKKIAGLLLIAFVVFYVLRYPDESSSAVRTGISALGDAANSVAQFVRSVFS